MCTNNQTAAGFKATPPAIQQGGPCTQRAHRSVCDHVPRRAAVRGSASQRAIAAADIACAERPRRPDCTRGRSSNRRPPSVVGTLTCQTHRRLLRDESKLQRDEMHRSVWRTTHRRDEARNGTESSGLDRVGTASILQQTTDSKLQQSRPTCVSMLRSTSALTNTTHATWSSFGTVTTHAKLPAANVNRLVHQRRMGKACSAVPLVCRNVNMGSLGNAGR